VKLPQSYDDSRRMFRQLAAKAGATVRTYDVPGTTPDGLALTTDTAQLGLPDARTMVAVTSGIHGAEGYAGAACLCRFLQAWPGRHAGAGIGFLLVHAINPWGFAHDSRVTEEGVDLNRNFVDFPRSATQPAPYEAFHRMLVEEYRPLPQGWRNQLQLLSHGLTAPRRRALQNAVTSGQYDRTDGMFFGGFAATKSRGVWEQILRDTIDGRQRAFLLDLHTGLGQRGSGELMCDLPKTSASFRQMADWFDGRISSMADGDSVSAALSGTMTGAFMRSQQQSRYAIGLEFGTCPQLVVLNALRADQWRRNNAGMLSPRQEQRVREKMKHAFAPADAPWAARVAARFDEVMEQLSTGLANHASKESAQRLHA
jgi:succinylglutamate desuccinylase